MRVQASASYKYGWIKIVGTSFILWVSTTLTMGTFACENGGVDIEQLSSKSEQVTIYPNPARNRLQVTSGSNKIILISIYNMQGLEMISTTEKEIDVSNLQEGVYFARVKTSEGMLAKKIIIQR